MSFTEPHKAKVYLQGRMAHMPKAMQAAELVYKTHNGVRKDGVTPEWFHQVSILMYLLPMEGLFYKQGTSYENPGSGDGYDYWRFSVELYVTALLHDIHEDYGYSLELIATMFNETIAKSVEVLSKKSPGGFKKSNADYYHALSQDPLASIVKGADRIHNLQTMQGVFTPEKQAAYIKETEDIVLPMLKVARKKFPERAPAYELIKHMLLCQTVNLKR